MRVVNMVVNGSCCVVASIVTLTLSVPSSLRAQVETPPSSPAHMITPGEAAAGLEMYESHILSPVTRDGRLVPDDSVPAAIAAQTRQWITEIGATPAHGLQLNAMGELYVEAGQDQLAQQEFDERLSAKGLSVADKAYTLMLAVKLFADPINVERMRLALAYMVRLDALPAEAMTSRYEGHVTLAAAYYDVGNGPEVVRQMTLALGLVSAMPFLQRGVAFYDQHSFVMLADVLSGMPNGHARIDSITRSLRMLATPTAAMVATDSAYLAIAQAPLRSLTTETQIASHLGLPAPPIVATHWYNATAPATASNAAPGARQLTLADGKIRLLEYGDFGCEGCQLALPGMERLHKTAPANVEVWYVTQTQGSWGATSVSPEQEAEHLRHYYLERKHLDLPMAVWAGPKDSTVDGGAVPRDDPSYTAYPVIGVPMFVLVDGHGIVRHISSAGYSEQEEQRLTTELQYLINEAKRSSAN